MNVVDLLKATIGCGLLAYVVYTVPQVSQGLIIGLLTLLWLLYAHKVLIRRR